MELVEWLPKMVGIERSVELVLPGDAGVVSCIPEEAHEDQLTRPDVTASVHYVRFELTPAEVEAFGSGAGDVVLRVNHLHYDESTVLSPATVASLLEDLRPSS